VSHSFAEIGRRPDVDVGTVHPESGASVELLFDSFCQPAYSGIRSGPWSKTMLYRADPFQIDLQLEATGSTTTSSSPDSAGR